MRSQKQRQNDEGRDHRYNPPRFRIEEAREALGLSDDSTGQQAAQALKQLLENTAALPAAMKLSSAHEAVKRAFIPGKPDLFGPAAELEAQNPEKLLEVLQSIRDLRSGLERLRAFPRYCSEEMPGTPASSPPVGGFSRQELPASKDAPSELSNLKTPHNARSLRLSGQAGPAPISGAIARVLADAADPLESARRQERARRVIEPLRDVLDYLVKHGIIPTTAREDARPAEDRIAQHGIVWLWRADFQRYDPRLNTGRNQSFFTAGNKYFQRVLQNYRESPSPQSQAKLDLIANCMRARAFVEPDTGIESFGQSLAREITGCSVDERTILRWKALYSFLKDTNAFGDSR